MADQELTSWCMLNGVTFNGIVAAFVSEGWRGIVATRDLQPGEAVLRVPERLLLTTRSAARDPQLAAALQRHTERSRGVAAAPSCGGGCGLGPHQVLACHLLLEVSRGPQSFWWPYLKQLPRSYTSLANFSPDDVAELQLQDALDAAEAAVERARTEWRQALHVLHDLPLPKRFTAFRAWLWATSTLHSRTMYLPWCPAGCLTPYGDLHNYQPPRAPYTPRLGGPAATCSSLSAAAAAAPDAGAVAVDPPVAPPLPSAPGPECEEHATPETAAAAASSLDPPLVLEPLPRVAVDGGGDERLAAFDTGDANGARAGCGASSSRSSRSSSSNSSRDKGGGGGNRGHHDGSSDLSAGAVSPVGAGHGDLEAHACRAGSCMGRCNGLGNDGGETGDCGGEAREGGSQDGATGLGSWEDVKTGLQPPSSSTSLGPTEADSAAVGKGNDNAKSGVYDGDGGDVNGGGSGGYDDGGGSDVGGSGGGTLANTGGRDEEDCEYTIAGDGMWDEATQQYCIVVRRPYREGEQVMLCYGRYTNLELLEYYGFVLEGNLHDTARLDPALLPLPSAARTAGGAPHLAPSDCFLHANGQPSWQLLHLLRYCAASPVERRSAGHLMAAGERVSEQGDRLALKWLHAACGSQLAALPTTVVQDLELLRQLNGTQEPEVRQRQQQQQQQNEVVPRPQHEAVCEAVAAAVSPVALGAGMSPRKEVAQATEEGPGAAEPPGAARDVAVAGATKAAAVPNCTPQSHAPPSQPAAVPTEAAAASGGVSARALSDGLTCARLALQWRIQQKQILLRALRYAEDVLGPDAHAAAARGRPPVLAGGLSALIQRQRKVLAPTRPSYNQDDLSPA